MRTIKFRGLRVDGKGWVYGFLVVDPWVKNGFLVVEPWGESRIYYKPFDEATSNTYQFVTPETVGQFTGLFDEDGKEIYEGDKLSAGESVVIIQHKGRGFEGKFINKSQLYDFPIQNNNYLHWKIIGNIHEK